MSSISLLRSRRCAPPWRFGIGHAQLCACPRALSDLATTCSSHLDGARSFRRESGMRDRNARAVKSGHCRKLGVELLRESLDDAGAESGFSLSALAARLTDPIVGDGKLPIRADRIICDRNLAFDLLVGKRMLEGIHHE